MNINLDKIEEIVEKLKNVIISGYVKCITKDCFEIIDKSVCIYNNDICSKCRIKSLAIHIRK